MAFLALLFGNFAGLSQSISGFTPLFCSTNQMVQINGSGFTGATHVIFYNNKIVSVSPTADNQIHVVVPFGATTGPIQVKKGGTIVSSVDNLIIIGKEPYVTSFSPISGSAGTVVTLQGTHFSGTTSVRFNGTNAAFSPPVTDTQLTITAPAGVTTGPISITRSNTYIGTTVSNFFVSPSITSFSPTNGRSGTNIVITGKNFLGTTFVKFNGVSAPAFTVDSNTQISVALPASATTGTINISTPGGQFFTTSNFVVQPSIFSFSPSFGKAGTNVTITGVNLNGATAVSFNGAAVSPSGVTATQLSAIVPVMATSGPLTVTTTNGSATTISNFYLPPVISTFLPSSGSPGTVVTLTGFNFTNATEVSFGGVSASFSVAGNSITVTVPAGAMSGLIVVTAPGGTGDSGNYFYVKPVVSGFSPGSGLAGTLVTITGNSFSNATAVLFNGLNASFTPGNNTQLTAVVPTNATTGPISVVAPAGTGVSAGNFVVDTLTLSVKLLTNGPVVISWTTNATGFLLQANTNLNSQAGWLSLTNVPVVVSGKNTVTNSPTNSATFYRLKK